MYKERKNIYSNIEKFMDSRVICYVTGDRQNLEIHIDQDVLEHFGDHLYKMGMTKRITLIIHSRGGITLAGWSLVNLIRQFCDEFNIIIPSRAHSAATLIALGAKSIMMTRQATLGPIDPNVNGPLNPQAPAPNTSTRIPVSVESVKGYLDFAKSLGIKSEAEITRVVLDLASKIHPAVLGNVFRSRSQIRMLGKQLLSTHIQEESKIEKILDFLCSDCGSHDYTINRSEARDELGLPIAIPDDAQNKIIRTLHKDYCSELELLNPFNPNLFLGDEPEKEYSFTRGVIESVRGGSTRFISQGKLIRTKTPEEQPQNVQEPLEDRKTFEGWTNK